METADGASPPLPGNDPAAWTDAAAIRAKEIAARIKALGSPSVSELLDLPQAAGGADAKFGLDLQPLLARIAGPRQPGTYLVGLRPLQGTERATGSALQVTDLSLTAVEEPGRVRFEVTSLATARPVGGAQIGIEGIADKDYRVLAAGTTDADGAFFYVPRDGGQAAPQRIVVRKATDTLVLQTAPGPPQLCQRQLDAAARDLAGVAVHQNRDQRARREAAHPVPRVHRAPDLPPGGTGRNPRLRPPLSAWRAAVTSGKGTLLVQGPDKQEWRYPVTLDDTSGFYLHFDAKTVATGDYTVSFQPEHEPACDSADFKKEAYRLPTFEVLLNNAPQVPLDAPFQVGLLARYYAGGVVTDRPIKWRVTQFPYTWTPAGPRRLPVLQRCAVLRRPGVPLHAGDAERRQDRCRRFGATDAGSDAGADGAATHLRRRGDGHRR